MHLAFEMVLSRSLPIPRRSLMNASDGGWCASWHDFWDERCVCTASLSFHGRKKKKRKRERMRATVERNIALPCWTVTTDYLWISNSEKPKVRSGVESVDKTVSVEVLVLEILRVAEKFKVQCACACKRSRRTQMKELQLLNDVQWLPASDVGRDAIAISTAKTRIRSENYASLITNTVSS